MDAVAELTAEKGYEATKIADIVRRAKVARKTLYDNFDGKEELFLAAVDFYLAELRNRVTEACAESEDPWQRRVDAGLAAFLGFLSERPVAARMCMIEALSATPEAAARYDAAVHEFVEMLREAVPPSRACPTRSRRRWSGGLPGSRTSRSGVVRRSERRSYYPNCRSSCFLRTTV